jgi:DNA-binding response OmpR family regulator
MTITAARSSVKPKPTFTVLIVDDNRDFVEFLKFLLSHDGFNIRWAFNGPDALKSARDQTVDLVILDVMMPKMDGLNRLPRTQTPAPIITGDSTNGQRRYRYQNQRDEPGG